MRKALLFSCVRNAVAGWYRKLSSEDVHVKADTHLNYSYQSWFIININISIPAISISSWIFIIIPPVKWILSSEFYLE